MTEIEVLESRDLAVLETGLYCGSLKINRKEYNNNAEKYRTK